MASAEMVIALPIVVLVTMLAIQAALIWHAKAVARTAAEEGASSAHYYNATSGDGYARVNRLLNALGNGLIINRRIHVDRGNADVRVTVDGQIKSLVPGFHPTVHSVSVQAVERYVAPTQGGKQ